MKLAIIGTRGIKNIDIENYIDFHIDEIVTGGANGVDVKAKEYAEKHSIPLKEFLPEYNRYKRAAPLKRNTQTINYSDKIIVFWDGQSTGTAFVISESKKQNKDITVILV